MGIQIGSTSSSVAIVGEVTATAAVRTVTLAANNTATTGSTTLKTVGAGKKVTIIGASVCSTARGATTLFKSQITANGTAILTAQNYSASDVGQGAVGLTRSWAYGDAPVLTEGQTIVHSVTSGSGSVNQSAEVQYVEEDV